MEDFTPRHSKFLEGTMNSTASIHPPPEELLREGLDRETCATPDAKASHKKWPSSSVTQIPDPAPTTTHEGSIFGRFGRAAASLFRGSGFSGLGKRKREDDVQPKETRKEEVERAYADAKRLGLLPEPTVYVRPIRKRRSPGPSIAASDGTRTSTSSDISRTGHPRLRSTPSKKDLQKQAKLRKKLSNLEQKLAKTREKLNEALTASVPSPTTASFAPTMSPIAASVPATPVPVFRQPEEDVETIDVPRTKKRKVGSDDEDADSTYRSTAATESDCESEPSTTATPKRTRSNKRQRSVSGQSRVLRKRKSSIGKTEHAVVVVPDGATVPPIPPIPPEVDGKRVKIGSGQNDFGGLEHEIF